MKKSLTNIFSIFGQVEGVIADAMTKERRVRRISFVDIPPTQQFDDQGRKAHCALVMTAEMEREFNQRVATLRA